MYNTSQGMDALSSGVVYSPCYEPFQYQVSQLSLRFLVSSDNSVSIRQQISAIPRQGKKDRDFTSYRNTMNSHPSKERAIKAPLRLRWLFVLAAVVSRHGWRVSGRRRRRRSHEKVVMMMMILLLLRMIIHVQQAAAATTGRRVVMPSAEQIPRAVMLLWRSTTTATKQIPRGTMLLLLLLVLMMLRRTVENVKVGDRGCRRRCPLLCLVDGRLWRRRRSLARRHVVVVHGGWSAI
jgi:hypothetical protein